MEFLSNQLARARKSALPFLVITSYDYRNRSIKGKLVAFNREGIAEQRADAKSMIMTLRDAGYDIPSLWHSIIFADKPLDARLYKLFSHGLIPFQSMTIEELERIANLMVEYESKREA